MKSDKELIEEFEKDEGISIKEAELFRDYKHKIITSANICFDKHMNIKKNEKYITHIDNIKLKTPILISRTDENGNVLNGKGNLIRNSDEIKPTKAEASHWLYSKHTSEGCHEINNPYKTYVGKWLIFESPDKIDDTWNKVKDATDKKLLGISSKVSTKRQTKEYKGSQYVICVYTKDFRDKEDIKQVLQELRKIGILNKLYYKTDSTTIEGIYSKEGPHTKKIGKVSLYCSTDFEIAKEENNQPSLFDF